MERNKLLLGAVAYDPKVVTIWEGFHRYFEARSLAFDFVLYSNYEQQVEALLLGQIDVAWNSPLAWLQAREAATRRGDRAIAIAMRDTDCDLKSVIIGRDVERLGDLRGKVVAVGAADSPQATIIPLLHLAEAGLEPGRDVEVQRHDLLLGKHGDHIGGERDAVRALLDGRADAACILDVNYVAFSQDGSLPTGATRILATTAPYDHCNFTVLERNEACSRRFSELLLGMSYADPALRPLLDLEGLKEWHPGRTSGYAQLERAVERFSTLREFLARMERP
jgi:ABC-type phosphate/phosphonate transport system substrate-binding protein